MPGHELKHEQFAIQGAQALTIRSLLNRPPFAEPLGDAHTLGISSALQCLFDVVWFRVASLAADMSSLNRVPGERIQAMGWSLASLGCRRRGSDALAGGGHSPSGQFLGESLSLDALTLVSMSGGHGGRSSDQMSFPALGQKGLPEPKVSKHFSLVIGNEVLYELDEADGLAAGIARHATAVGQGDR